MYLFSIITICRNDLHGLIATYEGIKSQSLKDYEWFVVDGNSNDGTREWLNKNLSANQWVSESDNGIFDAMNKGIRFVSGKYLIFINSGDEFSDSNVLSTIQDLLNKSTIEPSFIYGDSIDEDELGNKYYRKAKDVKFIKNGMITQHQAMFFNKVHFPDLKFDLQYKLTGDYALICKIIRKSEPEKIVRVNFPICKFKMGGTNELLRFKAIYEDFKIRRKILNLSFAESSFLWVLHFTHTVIKKIIPSTRFIKHKQVKQQF
jgi:putative colanic acid biosynthesis glycosyltransferase